MPQSVLGTGIPKGRAGLDLLFQHCRTAGNISGATAGANITVTGIRPGDNLLFVLAGDGTDLDAADIEITAANTITCTVNTASKKLNVCWLDMTALAGQSQQGTEFDAIADQINTLLSVGLRLTTVAGANGAITVTGIAATDNLVSLWVSDATVDCDGSTWAVTANTVTPTPTVNTSGKFVHVLWLDVSASSGGDQTDWNTDLADASNLALMQFARGLRMTNVAGPAASTATLTLTGIATADNLLGIAISDLTPGIAGSGAWTISGANTLTRATPADALDSKTLTVMWVDVSAMAI